jgi:hydroxymethylbilane synthase
VNHILDRTILLGSRPSQLARWQTNHVAELLQNAAPGLKTQTVLITTEGDRVLDKPLPEIGGKGVFTAELESRLHSGEIDLVVHSLKDLPVEPSERLAVAAIPQRADAHDVLISPEAWTLATLPRGARVGTSSLRRSAQLLAARPDLQLLPLRGNVDTRVRKVMGGEYDAIVLAAAGVTRLGLDTGGMQILPFGAMLPAPGQGALAVQCRSQDIGLLALLRLIDHTPTRAAVTAERAFLAALGGGCSAPVAAYGTWDNEIIVLKGLVASVDGQHVLRLETTGTDSGEVGETLARQALDQGAGEWLK